VPPCIYLLLTSTYVHWRIQDFRLWQVEPSRVERRRREYIEAPQAPRGMGFGKGVSLPNGELDFCLEMVRFARILTHE